MRNGAGFGCGGERCGKRGGAARRRGRCESAKVGPATVTTATRAVSRFKFTDLSTASKVAGKVASKVITEQTEI